MKRDPFHVPPVLVFTLRGAWSEELRAAILADYESPEMVNWRAEQRRAARGEQRPMPRPSTDLDGADEDEAGDGPPSRDRLTPEAARSLLDTWGNPQSASRGTGIPRAEIREAYLRGGFRDPVPWRRGEQVTRKPAGEKALTRDEALEILAWYGSPGAAEKNIGIARSTIRDALARGEDSSRGNGDNGNQKEAKGVDHGNASG